MVVHQLMASMVIQLTLEQQGFGAATPAQSKIHV